MYIIKENGIFQLSSQQRGYAYAEIRPPVLVINGRETAAVVDFSDETTRGSHVENITITDRVSPMGGGIFRAVRKIHNGEAHSVSLKSIFEANTVFHPDHFVFPGFNYDTSRCPAPVKAGEILNTTREGLESSVHNTPSGLSVNGEPWVFAYDREGIPSATISENETAVFAMFASDEDAFSLESAASMIRNENGTYRHRLFHPVSEMPYTYAQKNSLEAPYETQLTLNAGEDITLSLYLFAGEPKFRNFGTANVMEAAGKVFPFSETPELSGEDVWRLGISYFRFLEQYVDGVPMFAGHLCDRLFPMTHAGELKGEAMAKAMEDPENRKLNTFSKSFEIGWGGQGAMVARLVAQNGFSTGNTEDVTYAEGCLDGFVSTQRENGLLFPLFGQHKFPEEKRRLPDACNMGWAMCELMRSYRLFRANGKIKQNYYDFSLKLAEFALTHYSEEYGFAKTWKIDGTPVCTDGSIGGFMIMGLCEVHRETGDRRFFDLAKKAMDFYYRRDIDNFVCTAGALDCACIDKETSYPFFYSALYLYELTGEAIWLERAEKAAIYFFSWMFFYDARYPADSDFSKYGYHTTGGTLISAEHSAIDGWGALLVEGMLKLWHITGNKDYLTWARMTWWNALLCITTEKTPEIHGNKRPLGSQNEGFFHCRWTKYRPTCEERGHFNENLQTWMGAWRLHTLSKVSKEDLEILWGKNYDTI